MTGAPDDQLIERCRSGEEDAFRELVQRYEKLVFALLARAVPDAARVEDLAQEVFLKVHRGLPYFRGDAKLSTWIYRITANVLAETRQKRDPLVASLDERFPETGELRLEPATIDVAYTELELRDRITKSVARLPTNYQLLINGHYLHGLKYEELAEVSGLPLGTVKTHLHRAKRLLRHLLEEDFR